MKQTVTVTQDDIDNGEPDRPSACPIALAIKRAWTGPRSDDLHVDVQEYAAIVWPDLDDDSAWIADLPREAHDFVLDFDHPDPGDAGVKPLTFDLDFEAS